MRNQLVNKKRIVIKIGSSSLVHPETGRLNLHKMEQLVRVLIDLESSGHEVVLVSSGAMALGRQAMGLKERPEKLSQKQALSAIGQARLMMTYQIFFNQYNGSMAQILMTRNTILQQPNQSNAKNTFEELISMGVIPIVNENDTVSTEEIEKVKIFGDNDHLSAVVAALISADLLILLSDIDGLFTDDPHKNPEAELISCVPEITQEFLNMGKDSSSSDFGTGGMAAKVDAAKFVTEAGTDMIIANGDNVEAIMDIMKGKDIGTWFIGKKEGTFDLTSYLDRKKEIIDGAE